MHLTDGSEPVPPPRVRGWRWPLWYAIGLVTGGLIPVLASPGEFALALFFLLPIVCGGALAIAFAAPVRVWILSMPAGAAAFVLAWAILATDWKDYSFAHYGYRFHLLAAAFAAGVVLVLGAFGAYLGVEIRRKIRTR